MNTPSCRNHGKTQKRRYFPTIHKMVIIPIPSTENWYIKFFQTIYLACMIDMQEENEILELEVNYLSNSRLLTNKVKVFKSILSLSAFINVLTGFFRFRNRIGIQNST